MKETEDVERAQVKVQEVEAELAALNADLERELAAVGGTGPSDTPLDVIEIKPKRGNVDVRVVALAWQPLSTPSTLRP